MSTHETLVEQAKVAITRVFSDTSVSKSMTRESMRDLRDHAGDYIDLIESELEEDEEDDNIDDDWDDDEDEDDDDDDDDDWDDDDEDD